MFRIRKTQYCAMYDKLWYTIAVLVSLGVVFEGLDK